MRISYLLWSLMLRFHHFSAGGRGHYWTDVMDHPREEQEDHDFHRRGVGPLSFTAHLWSHRHYHRLPRGYRRPTRTTDNVDNCKNCAIMTFFCNLL